MKTFVSILIVLFTAISLVVQLAAMQWLNACGPEWVLMRPQWESFLTPPELADPVLSPYICMAFFVFMVAHVVSAAILLVRVNDK